MDDVLQMGLITDAFDLHYYINTAAKVRGYQCSISWLGHGEVLLTQKVVPAHDSR